MYACTNVYFLSFLYNQRVQKSTKRTRKIRHQEVKEKTIIPRFKTDTEEDQFIQM